MPRRSRCLGNAARVALGTQTTLLYALQMLQLCGSRCMRSSSACRARRCRGGSAGSMRNARMMLRLLLLLLLVMVCMMMLMMMQRGAGCIVTDLLGQRLTASTQCRAQIVSDFRLSQQLLKNLQRKEDTGKAIPMYNRYTLSHSARCTHLCHVVVVGCRCLHEAIFPVHRYHGLGCGVFHLQRTAKKANLNKLRYCLD